MSNEANAERFQRLCVFFARSFSWIFQKKGFYFCIFFRWHWCQGMSRVFNSTAFGSGPAAQLVLAPVSNIHGNPWAFPLFPGPISAINAELRRRFEKGGNFVGARRDALSVPSLTVFSRTPGAGRETDPKTRRQEVRLDRATCSLLLIGGHILACIIAYYSDHVPSLFFNL